MKECHIDFFPTNCKSCCVWGEGIAQWWSHRLMIKRSQVQVPAGAAGEFFSQELTFCAESYFGIHPTPVLQLTAVARKRSQSFCQKCKWPVTAKHVCILHIWLCMKWQCKLVYGFKYHVHITCAKMAAVSHGTSHVTTEQCCQYTTLVNIQITMP